jgi:DNA-binding response OmpR family regulator
VAKLKHTILIVDDDNDTRLLLRDILEEAGFRVLQATDGLDALKKLNGQPVDMVVTDRAMPHMDGMALLSKLRDRSPALPVLMVSGYGEESFWSQAIGRGAKDYLLKPFKSEEVVTQIRKYLPKK